jgi:DNA (cytosine-5)-methyltransferase 1
LDSRLQDSESARQIQGSIKVVSLFAGAGGLDLGLKQAGMEIVWAVDNDPDAVATYRANIGNHILCEDVQKIESADIPDCDIVVGGFPCQGFSVANKFRSVSDERNILYREMLRVIRDKKPKWFVAENVGGILSLGGGRVFEKILADLDKVGYRVCHQLVNMADHGVPQMRKRVFILGTRKDLPLRYTISHPSATHSNKSKEGKLQWITINQALVQLRKFGKELPNDVGSKYKIKYRNFTGHRRTDGNKPSPTILARGNGEGGVCAIPHPSKPRRLTVRESAFVQTFPPNFEFSGKVNSMYRQIGNAVPILYGEKLGRSILRTANGPANGGQLMDQQMEDNTSKESPTAVSLFAGAGGTDLGFKEAGFRIIWANDNDPNCVATYRKNIGAEIVLGDIEDVDLDTIPQADVVIGGFPCQGFSVANMGRTVDDKRNVLYRHFVKIVAGTKPKLFVAENVKGILSLGKGLVFEKILNDFSNAGYECRYAILNAAHYGVPQSRERVVILGVRDDLDISVDFPPRATHSEEALSGLKKTISVGEALATIPEPDSDHKLKNQVYTKFKLKFNGYISNRKIDPRKPCPTITARGDDRGGAMILQHPNGHRRMSCREVATIQSFPLDFEFVGSMTSVYRQIGNAVPPLLAKAVAQVVKRALETERVSLTKSSRVRKKLVQTELVFQ